MGKVTHSDGSNRNYGGDQPFEGSSVHDRATVSVRTQVGRHLRSRRRSVLARVRARPLEMVVRVLAAAIGTALIVVTVPQITRPKVAVQVAATLGSPTGRLLAVTGLAILLLIGAVRGGTA